jgi:hypothetical protein
MPRYTPTRQLLLARNRAASGVIRTGYADTFPCPLSAHPDALLRCVYFPAGGGPGRQSFLPPEYVVDLDGVSGRVVRLERCTAAEVGCAPPLPIIPGAGVNPGMSRDDYWNRRERAFDLMPVVWEQFTSGATRTPEASELLATILTITPLDAAPFQVLPTYAFFRWMGV